MEPRGAARPARFGHSVAPGLRVGRGLERRRNKRTSGTDMLRPAFGSGEDWNVLKAAYVRRLFAGCARPSGRARIGTPTNTPRGGGHRVAPGLRVGRGLELVVRPVASYQTRLRPAFGSGEDWNSFAPVPSCARSELRPAFGSGEDWNSLSRNWTSEIASCARPSGRARIGTTGGDFGGGSTVGCARPSGRARIGTASPRCLRAHAPSCARPSGRARIGTHCQGIGPRK